MKTYTIEDLEKLTPDQRASLYQNARKQRENGGQAIMDFMDASGLSLCSGGMRMSDPAYLKIEEIVWSAKGRIAAMDATNKDLPALAGVEPLIVAELGDRYNPHDGGTVNAGYIQAGLMRHLAYVENGRGDMPDGSVAKTAMKWKPRSR